MGSIAVRPIGLAVATVLVPALVLFGSSVSASATTSQTVNCVASNATSCLVTIPLVPDMDVNLTIDMPPNNGWSESTILGVGPVTYTNPDGFTSGTGGSFLVLLQTGDSEPSNAVSLLTFMITPPSTSTTTPKSPKLPFSTGAYTGSTGQGRSAKFTVNAAGTAIVGFSSYLDDVACGKNSALRYAVKVARIAIKGDAFQATAEGTVASKPSIAVEVAGTVSGKKGTGSITRLSSGCPSPNKAGKTVFVTKH